jgi:uncharacterized protein (DUF4213/DUF364 family)
MEPVGYEAGALLRETRHEIDQILGKSIDQLTVERVVLGLFFTGVKLSNGTGGLCFTPLKSIPEAVCCPSSVRAMPDSGRLKARTAAQFVEEMFEGNQLKKAMGIAVMNALSMSCWKQRPPTRYSIKSGIDAIDEVVIPDTAYVVVVGAIIPVLRILKRRGKPFGILELDTTVLKTDELPYYIPPELAEEKVSQADLLIITGTTLINDTLEGLLHQRKPGAQVVIMGPTASGLPDAFFRRGVNVLGGVMVTEPDRVLDLIAEGGSGYHFFEKGADRIVIQPLV